MVVGMGRSGVEGFPFQFIPWRKLLQLQSDTQALCFSEAWYWSCVQMFRLALSSYIYFFHFETPIVTL